MKTEIEQLYQRQLKNWDLAKSNFEALIQVKTKTLTVEGATFKVQFNPARIVSSGAKIDSRSIAERKCFLCAENRPAVQEGVSFRPSLRNEHQDTKTTSPLYTVLVNPFPIFPKHFTIPDTAHEPQLIYSRFGDMLDLAKKMDDCVIFYNGPKCGASAPDHVHFQAGNKGFLPIEEGWNKHITTQINANLYAIRYGFPAFVIIATEKQDNVAWFEKIYHSLEIKAGETEPMMNVLAWYENSQWITIIIPRAKHRPACYTAEGDENMLISPASVDLGGVFITPLEKDFEKINAESITKILSEVCFDSNSFNKIIQQLNT